MASIKRGKSQADDVYTVIGERQLRSTCATSLKPLEVIELEGEPNGNRIAPLVVGIANQEEITAPLERLVASFQIKDRTGDAGLCPAQLVSKLEQAASALLSAFVSGTPIIVRFHRDGDGSSGAIALYNGLNSIAQRLGSGADSVIWRANKSIAYTQDSLTDDIAALSMYSYVLRPLLVIIDFGSSDESTAALRNAADYFDIVIIDHHVITQSFDSSMVKHYINPWNCGSDSSVAAGYIAGSFAEMLSGQDYELLKSASLISEYSRHADYSDGRASRVAAILDYLTGSAKDDSDTRRLTPAYMSGVLADQDKSDELFSYAHYAIDEAVSAAMLAIKEYQGSDGLRIYVCDFSRLADQGISYPPPGRCCSILQSRLEARNHGKTATIFYHNKFASIRISSDVSKSIDIVSKIERAKADRSAILSGGGHMEAAAVRFEENRAERAVRVLLSALGVAQTA